MSGTESGVLVTLQRTAPLQNLSKAFSLEYGTQIVGSVMLNF